jgi:hypothetical protein
MYCAECYRARSQPKTRRKRDWFLLSAGLQMAAGLLLLWATYHFIGGILLDIPSTFHEGAVWEQLAP